MSFLTSREQVAPHGIGKPVRRRKDARLLTGGGRFADETNLRGQGYACMVRSPHAHALIVSIDTGPAEGMPGVIAVLTGSDASGPNLGRALPLLGPRRGRAYLARSLSAPGYRGGKGGRGRSILIGDWWLFRRHRVYCGGHKEFILISAAIASLHTAVTSGCWAHPARTTRLIIARYFISVSTAFVRVTRLEGQLALYKGAPPDGPPPNADTLGAVEKWLRTSASPEKAAELIAFDRPNSTVAASLRRLSCSRPALP